MTAGQGMGELWLVVSSLQQAAEAGDYECAPIHFSCGMALANSKPL